MSEKVSSARLSGVLAPITVIAVSSAWALAAENYFGDGDYKQAAMIAVTLITLLTLSLKPDWNLLLQSFKRTGSAATSSPTPSSAPIPTTTPAKALAATPQFKWTPSFPSTATTSTSTPVPLAVAVPATPAAVHTPAKPPSSINRTPVASMVTPLSANRRIPVDESVFQSPSSPLVLKHAAKQDTPQTGTKQPSNSVITDRGSGVLVLATTGTTTPGSLTLFKQTTTLQQITTPSLVGTPSTAGLERPELTRIDEDAAYVFVQQVGLREGGRSGEVLLEEWVTNLKYALHGFITSQLLEPFDRTNKALAAATPFPSSSPMFSIALLEWEESERQNDLDELSSSLGIPAWGGVELNALLKARKELERYFRVKRRQDMMPFPRSYVLKRLRTLVKSESLSGYDWCGGESFDGKNWTADRLPTDAEILFRVFCVWMDKLLQRDERDPSFSATYVKDADRVDVEELRASEWTGFLNCGRFISASSGSMRSLLNSPAAFSGMSGDVASSGQRAFFPHWKLMVTGSIREVKSRRLNLFHSIILFLYVLKVNNIARLQDIMVKVFAKSRLA